MVLTTLDFPQQYHFRQIQAIEKLHQISVPCLTPYKIQIKGYKLNQAEIEHIIKRHTTLKS